MSAAVEIPKNTDFARLDEMVGRLRDGAKTWVKLPVGEKIGVARRMLDGFSRIAMSLFFVDDPTVAARDAHLASGMETGAAQSLDRLAALLRALEEVS